MTRDNAVMLGEGSDPACQAARQTGTCTVARAARSVAKSALTRNEDVPMSAQAANTKAFATRRR
jgi:hypothetical protein